MTFCPNCNINIQDGDDSCFICGYNVKSTNKIESTSIDIDLDKIEPVISAGRKGRICSNPKCKLFLDMNTSSCVCGANYNIIKKDINIIKKVIYEGKKLINRNIEVNNLSYLKSIINERYLTITVKGEALKIIKFQGIVIIPLIIIFNGHNLILSFLEKLYEGNMGWYKVLILLFILLGSLYILWKLFYNERLKGLLLLKTRYKLKGSHKEYRVYMLINNIDAG